MIVVAMSDCRWGRRGVALVRIEKGRRDRASCSDLQRNVGPGERAWNRTTVPVLAARLEMISGLTHYAG